MNREEFLGAAGVEGQTLEIWLEQSWIVPAHAGSKDAFTQADLARASLILELQNDMGANDAGIDIILHLLDQLHSMRRVVASMRDEIGAGQSLAIAVKKRRQTGR